ncbi:FAD/NAD(P)-binding domain-containing protein [Thozetella sp. PMI_491]|nr:FAD/NAD(P)-binding domain-containing protein [Thozetella sp. PMI_491]
MGSRVPPTPSDVRNIAIVGAGPCGLAAAKYLLAQGVFDSIIIYEQQSEVGGVWDYSAEPSATLHVPQVSAFCPPDPPIRPDGAPPVFPTPMYSHLHTNIPRALMQFSDLPFREDSLIFPTRQDVERYLTQYAEGVRHLIQFSTQVKDIQLRRESGKDQWDLVASSTITGESVTETFDAVVVASGHYSTTYVPNIRNITEFHKAHPGVITHSKLYRTPEVYSGKKVVVVGNSASGLDVGSQISRFCKQPLLLSVRTATPQENLSHVGAEELPEIEEFLVDQRGIRLKDGRVETGVDAVIFATGYLYAFPSLTSLAPPLVTDGRRVHRLYKHLFHIDYPTLAFPGLPIKVVPLPFAESQAAAFARVWAGLLALPSTEEMSRWEDDEVERRGPKFHVFPPGGDADYINSTYDWIAASGAPGKMPPRWDEELMWQRKIYAQAKLKFEIEGCKAKSLEELGFVFSPSERDVERPDTLQISLDIVP